MMLAGMKNGDTFFGECVSKYLSYVSSIDSSPPIPEAMSTPIRCELASVTANPESRMACMPPTTPYCMKASMRRTSLGLKYGVKSSPLISPPKCVGKLLVSKRVIGAMPLRPATIDAHAAETSLPTGDTIPRPVTTTRRLLNGDSSNGCLNSGHGRRPSKFEVLSLLQLQWVLGLALVRIVIVDGLLNRGNFFGILVRDFSLEFLFECHDQFNRVQRVCTQVVDERGVIGDFFFFDAQLFGHDLLNLLLNCTHRYGVLSRKT